MKRLILLGLTLAALATFTVSAEAGDHSRRRHRSHFGHNSFRSSYGFRSRFVSRYGNLGRHYGNHPRVHRTWHDTSHYDYHPGEYVRHGNHFHYQPGHYDLHRTGHWDTHRHH